ncbi:PGF-CTERM sorting domain-containing protein [Haloferax namakaokahaiae]|uniref:PGF-CTERM sorting domain-containing protein n=1 Tax=Haloferax namakaokahaiae TaxID=1748331 RepID=A0ABD5ZAT8_9EURY
MDRNALLAGGAIGIVAIALVTALVVPGVLADPTDDGPVRPGRISVSEVTIAAGAATGETATLDIETRIEHGGNPTDNVSVLVRAIDEESGLRMATEQVSVGNLTRDGEVTAGTNLTVPREGGYDIDVILYRNAERVDTAQQRIRGVEAIKPPYLRTNTEFTESEALPPVSFSIAEAGDNRSTLDVGATLTNTGDTPTDDLSVRFVLRQAESNIVASQSTVDVGEVGPGRTATVETPVTVPNDYNYYIDAVLVRDGVVIDTARGAANLNPTRTISVNETTEEVELEVSDFEDSDTTSGDDDYRTEESGATQTGTPGFGPVVALVALCASVLALRRWRQ